MRVWRVSRSKVVAGPAKSVPAPPQLPEGEIALDDFVAAKSEVRKKRRSSEAVIKRAMAEADAMRALHSEGDETAFDDAEPRHLVAMYAQLHKRVYGAAPLELHSSENYMGAVSATRRLIVAEFDGSFLRALQFVRWVWSRELSREKWRRANRREGGSRIGWRLMFARRDLLTDYRVELARKKGQS